MNPDHESIVKECVGCKHVVNDGPCTLAFEPSLLSQVCETKWRPEAMWLSGKRCPWASHLEKKKEEVKAVDPIKASKRSVKGR